MLNHLATELLLQYLLHSPKDYVVIVRYILRSLQPLVRAAIYVREEKCY